MVTCSACGRPMVWVHEGRGPGVMVRAGRGLCKSCYGRIRRFGELSHFDRDREQWKSEELVQELFRFGLKADRPLMPQFRELAPRLGLTPKGVEKAWGRYWARQNALDSVE